MRKLSIIILSVSLIQNTMSQTTTFQKALGSAFDDRCNASAPTTDGGFIMAGWSESFGNGNWDVYLVKTNAFGNVEWSRIFGDFGNDDMAYDVQQTSDGGFIITGRTDLGNGGRDVYLIKTDASGSLQWSKTYGGNNDDEGNAVEQTTDGGFIITGTTRSYGSGGRDVYLIKTNSTGGIQWARAIGGGNDDEGADVHQTTDGGYIITGYTRSYGGGGRNVYLIKTNSNGNISWTKVYRTGNDEYGYAVAQAVDGGYVITGRTDDFNPGNWDMLLLKTSGNGNLTWSTAFGGADYDAGYAIRQTSDGGYIIAGETMSFGSGGVDAFLLKTDNNGSLLWSKTYGGGNDDEGWSLAKTVDGGFIIGGRTRSYGAGGWDCYLVKTDSLGNNTCGQQNAPIATINYNPSTSSGSNFSNGNNSSNPNTSEQSVISYTGCICLPTVDFTSTAPTCTGLTVDFTNLSSTGLYYFWDFGSGAIPSTSTQQNPAGIVYSTAGSKQVTLIVTDSMCTDSFTISIIIHQTPVVSFTSTAPQCAGTGVDFTNTGATGFNWSYNWDFGQDATPAVSNSENPIGISFTSGGAKVVSFTISDQFCTNTDTANISINGLPLADAGPDTTICNNDTVQIGSSPLSNMTYQWSPSDSIVIDNPAVANPLASPVAHSTLYMLTVTDNNTGCVNTDTVMVTMLDPIRADAGTDVVICRYDSVQIGASLIEEQLYSWSPSFGINDTSISSPIVSPDSTTVYILSVTNNYGCRTVTDQVTVLVHQLPDANAGADDTITMGSTAQLVATGGVQYEWTPAWGLDNTGIYNPIAGPDSTTAYIVTVTDIYGCVQSDTMILTVLAPGFWLPTAFTPDNDGLNDVLYVRGEGIRDFEFSIFDRWGHVIFYSRNQERGWDGTKEPSGEAMPEGAYVYVIKATLSDGTPVNKNGLVHLIR